MDPNSLSPGVHLASTEKVGALALLLGVRRQQERTGAVGEAAMRMFAVGTHGKRRKAGRQTGNRKRFAAGFSRRHRSWLSKRWTLTPCRVNAAPLLLDQQRSRPAQEDRFCDYCTPVCEFTQAQNRAFFGPFFAAKRGSSSGGCNTAARVDRPRNRSRIRCSG